MKVSLKHVNVYRDRNGHRRQYLRVPGQKAIPLPGFPGSPEFMAAYNAGIAGLEIVARPKPPIGASRSTPGSVSGAIAAYYTDNSFLALAPSTKAMRRAILERFREKHGDQPIRLLKQENVARILGRLKPFAARNWLKALRGLMQFAMRIGLRPDDPTDGITPLRARAGSIHTWTEDEIEAFERHHAEGTRPRLALALLLYTAARRGDAIGLGPQHIRAGRLLYRQQKTGRALAIPVHPLLAAEIERAEPRHLTFLVTDHGTPYTATWFSHWFRECCDAAGLPQCSAHGLRKACARRLAEAGCSAHEIAAITGHKTLAEVQRYADAASQATMAEAAIRTIARTAIYSEREGRLTTHCNPLKEKG